MTEPIRCRFACSPDTDPPVVRVALSDGCICYPADREQLLCWHHYERSTPLGTSDIVEDYTVEGFFRRRERTVKT